MNSERNNSNNEWLINKNYIDTYDLKGNSHFYGSNVNDEYYENFYK